MTDQSPPAVAGAPAKQPPFATRDVLAVLSTLLFAAAYFAPWIKEVPATAAQAVGQMQGAVISQWAMIMSWYFGSSKSASQKDDTIATMAAKAPDNG